MVYASLLRRWLPRSFYARAALIVLLPVLMVQLAVAVSFLQRHYEDVTDQMTASMIRTLEVAHAHADLAADLGIALVPPPQRTRMRWYDLSGRAMLARLRRGLPEMTALDLVADRKTVLLGLADGTGMAFRRDAVTASNPHQLLVLMVLVALVMTAISMLFLRGQIRPIRRLARAADAFGRGQTVPYRPAGATEVRQAGTAFLNMRARIERHIEQRTLLLSGVSHDLRTPLTRMTLELSMMDGPEAAALRQDVEAMRRIIDTFLDFARTDATDGWDEIELIALLRASATQALPGVDVAVDGPATTLRVSPVGMDRAVGNLLRNAARYGTRVRAGVQPSSHAVVLTVEDDGPGIPRRRAGNGDAALRAAGARALEHRRQRRAGPGDRARRGARAWRDAAAGAVRPGRAEGGDRPAPVNSEW